MDNPICDFQIIESPNRRYANTVNVVFFRAIPLTKNFQKYVDGLKNWKMIMPKYYPESQLQLFVDKSIASDPEIQKVLFDLNARIYLFECPDYLREDQFHIGLFGTMIRFYPFFDINKHPMKIAHTQELEPDPDSLYRFEYVNKASLMKFETDLGVIYDSHDFFEEPINYKNQTRFENGLHFPWMSAGRFTAMTKIPFSLWSDYVKDIENGKKFYNRYVHTSGRKAIVKEHGNFSFGVDESFLNEVYLKWLIKNNYGIGIVLIYKISYPLYYLREKIKKDSRSVKIFSYILQKNYNNFNTAYQDFDNLFYSNEKSKKAIESAPRFYEVIEKYPNWLGVPQTTFLLKVCKGYLSRICIVVIKDNNIVEIRDL
jgi:hypothetical protein